MTKTTMMTMMTLAALLGCGDDDAGIDGGPAMDGGPVAQEDATSGSDSATNDDSMVAPPLYAQPETALWDEMREVWYVSNVSGESTDADGEGWIVQLDSEGEPLDPRWVEGLNAPKGLAIQGDFLYVADLTDLIQINIAEQRVVGRFPCPESMFLNDVTVDEDTVYISDTFAAAIYRWQPGEEAATLWVSDPMLAAINGIIADGDAIIAGTIGDFMDPEDLGNLLSINREDGVITLVASAVAKFDGIIVDGDSYLATDFRGLLVGVERDGTVTLIDDLTMSVGFASAADFGFDPVRRLAAVPDLFASRVEFISVP